MHLSGTVLGRSLLACAILLLAACSVRADTSGDPPMTHATVTMHRSTCFGVCPSYTVVMQPDGQIRLTGHAHVRTKDASGHANAAQMAAIESALEKARFATLHNSYGSRTDGCEMVMSDMPGVTITVADASGSKTVDFYKGCTSAVADAVRPRIEQLTKAILISAEVQIVIPAKAGIQCLWLGNSAA